MKNNNFENDFNIKNLSKDDLFAICDELRKMLLNVKLFLLKSGYSESDIRDIIFEQTDNVKRTRTKDIIDREEYMKMCGNDILFDLYIFLTEEIGISRDSLTFTKK
jgi:hypothetical protein